MVAAAFTARGVARAGEAHVGPVVNVVSAGSSAARFPDDLPGPQDEVVNDPPRVELPVVPAFTLPASEPGFHAPRELRVRGQALLGAELKVRGYVTWIYDCVAELERANPRAGRAQLEAAIEREPALCERPMFSLGDARDASREASIWVVDAPRSPGGAPALAVGDYVVVTGAWGGASAIDSTATGVLAYKALAHAAPGPAPALVSASPPEPPEIAIDTTVPLRAIVDTTIRNTSVDALNACNRANARKQYDAALVSCRAATTAWPDNHLAWYAAAGAHLARAEWDQAVIAAERAVALRPDQAMYQLVHGMALYEAERQRARAAPIARRARPSLDAARDALVRATRLGPKLWRAHYYLGRVYRELDDARRAAEQLGAAITAHPRYRLGYIALIELYRRWGYVDQALAVARLGTSHVATAEAGELWFEVAMVYEARRADREALDALDHALASRPDDASSKLQRGQLYARRADLASARRDLEDAARSADPGAVAVRQVAARLLDELAGHDEPAGARCTRGCRVYRPSTQPYQPWTTEDAKYRF